jgi:hypothetical protein
MEGTVPAAQPSLDLRVSSTEMPRSRLFLPALATAAFSVMASFALPASGTVRPSAIHVARCAANRKPEWQEAKTDQNPRAAETTVPMAPSALQLCRYYGFGAGHQTPQTKARAGELRSERILTKAAEVRSIAREFDALQKVPEGPIYCPADEGARLYAVFAYPNRAEPKVPVEAHLSGCSFVWNGLSHDSFWATPQLIGRLKVLTSGKS